MKSTIGYLRTLDDPDDVKEFEANLSDDFIVLLAGNTITTKILDSLEEYTIEIIKKYKPGFYNAKFKLWADDQDNEYPRWKCTNCGKVYQEDEQPDCCAPCDFCHHVYAVNDLWGYAENANGKLYVCDECKIENKIE